MRERKDVWRNGLGSKISQILTPANIPLNLRNYRL